MCHRPSLPPLLGSEESGFHLWEVRAFENHLLSTHTVFLHLQSWQLGVRLFQKESDIYLFPYTSCEVKYTAVARSPFKMHKG